MCHIVCKCLKTHTSYVCIYIVHFTTHVVHSVSYVYLLCAPPRPLPPSPFPSSLPPAVSTATVRLSLLLDAIVITFCAIVSVVGTLTAVEKLAQQRAPS